MTVVDPGKLYCYNHPKRETHLRCNKCERPICSSCAVLTPTGYRCKECVRGQQKIFETMKWWDFPVAAVVGFVLSMIGSLVVNYVGYFAIILSFFVGIGIAEAIRFSVRRRRSRNLPLLVAIVVFLGGMALSLPTFFYLFSYIGQVGFIGLYAVLWPFVYALIAAGTAFYRLKGIRI